MRKCQPRYNSEWNLIMELYVISCTRHKNSLWITWWWIFFISFVISWRILSCRMKLRSPILLLKDKSWSWNIKVLESCIIYDTPKSCEHKLWNRSITLNWTCGDIWVGVLGCWAVIVPIETVFRSIDLDLDLESALVHFSPLTQ